MWASSLFQVGYCNSSVAHILTPSLVLGNIPWMRDVLALAPQPDPILTFQKFAAKKVEETKQKNGGAAKQDILGTVVSVATISISRRF
jgi:hypothetical protein